MNQQEYFNNFYNGPSTSIRGNDFNNSWQMAVDGLNSSLQNLGATMENRRNMERAEKFAREQQFSAQMFSQFQQSKADANNDIRSVADAMRQMGLDPINAQFRGSSTGASGTTTSPVYPSDHIPQMIALNEQHNKNKMDFLLGLKRLGVDTRKVDSEIDEVIKDSGRKDRQQANQDAMTISQIDNMNRTQQLEQEKFNAAVDQFNQTLSETKTVNAASIKAKFEELELKGRELQQKKWEVKYNRETGERLQSNDQQFKHDEAELQRVYEELMDQINKEWQSGENDENRTADYFKTAIQAIGIILGLTIGRGKGATPPATPKPYTFRVD